MKFSIETVCQMTGISSASLRNWEKRYGFPCPIRSGGGHRFYCEKDIQFLKQVVSWLSEGRALSQIAEEYKRHRSAKIETSTQTPHQKSEILDDVSFRVELIYHALLNFDCAATQQHYTILNMKLNPELMLDRVFEPLLRKIGDDWATEEISVAQEHFASSYIRLKIASMFSIDFPSTHQYKILLATTEKERHEGGLMIVAAHLKFRGYPVVYLGCDLPVDAIESVCRELRPAVVCLSFACNEGLSANLDAFSKLSCPVCIGGQAIPQIQDSNTRIPPNVHLCSETKGSTSASFVEMIARSRKL